MLGLKAYTTILSCLQAASKWESGRQERAGDMTLSKRQDHLSLVLRLEGGTVELKLENKGDLKTFFFFFEAGTHSSLYNPDWLSTSENPGLIF